MPSVKAKASPPRSIVETNGSRPMRSSLASKLSCSPSQRYRTMSVSWTLRGLPSSPSCSVPLPTKPNRTPSSSRRRPWRSSDHCFCIAIIGSNCIAEVHSKKHFDSESPGLFVPGDYDFDLFYNGMSYAYHYYYFCCKC